MNQSTPARAVFLKTAHQRAALCVSLLFIFMSVAFLARGLQQILLPHSATQAKDLRTNWTEMQTVLHRVSPYADPSTASPYPPWTFPANLAFYAPPWALVKPWFVLINLGCLLFLAAWAWRIARRESAADALLLATSITAFSSIATGLGLGQNAILYTAILTGSLLLYEAGWQILSGLLLGIAMSKINIALPFMLPFIFRKETKVVAAAAAYVLGGTLLVAFWVRANPWEMMKAWLISAQRNNGVPYGPASLLTCIGVPATTAARSCAVVFLGAAAAVLGRLRQLPMITLYGLAAAFGRLWTYHRVYDNVMLAFLLVALADLAFRAKSRAAALAWLLVGVTLWLPIHSMDIPVVHLIHVLIWIAAVITLARVAAAPLP